MGIPGPPAQTLATLIFDGVLEAFPELRIGVIEQGAIWVPSWLRQMESAFEAFSRHEERLQALVDAPVGLRAPPGPLHALSDRGRGVDRAGRRGPIWSCSRPTTPTSRAGASRSSASRRRWRGGRLRRGAPPVLLRQLLVPDGERRSGAGGVTKSESESGRGSGSVAVSGLVEPGFEAVRDAFARNFDEGREVGAAFCVHVDGRKVVDLVRGLVRRATVHEPYGPDTLQLVFSSTKGATAACANLLAQRGDLDLDAPVTTYWPEFAQAGKGDMPVRYLLSHQAGLPAVDRTPDLGGDLGLGPDRRRARRPAAVLGAGHRPRLPRRLVRLSGRRGRPAHQRAVARDLLRRGGRRAARARLLHRAARRARAAGLPHRRPAHRGGGGSRRGGGRRRQRRPVRLRPHPPGPCPQPGRRHPGPALDEQARAGTPPRCPPATASPTPPDCPACTPASSARSTAVRPSPSSTPSRWSGPARRSPRARTRSSPRWACPWSRRSASASGAASPVTRFGGRVVRPRRCRWLVRLRRPRARPGRGLRHEQDGRRAHRSPPARRPQGGLRGHGAGADAKYC